MTGGENGHEDVGAAQRGERSAVQNRQEEKSQCSQVAEDRSEGAGTGRPRALQKKVQYGQYINLSERFEENAGHNCAARYHFCGRRQPDSVTRNLRDGRCLSEAQLDPRYGAQCSGLGVC